MSLAYCMHKVGIPGGGGLGDTFMGKREGMEERGSYRVCEHVLVTIEFWFY